MYRGSMKDQVTVSVPSVPGGGVHHFFLAPDGRHIAFLADQKNNGVYELYLVELIWRKQLKPKHTREIPTDSPYATGTSATAEVPFEPQEVEALTLGETKKLAAGVSTKQGVHWSPDSDVLAYFSDREHQVQIVDLPSGVTRSHRAGLQRDSGQPVLPGRRSSLLTCSGNNGWSVDGTSFAYIMGSMDSPQDGQVTILTPVGEQGLSVHSVEGGACT